MSNKIKTTTIKEYNLDKMSLWELRDFANKQYNFDTYYMFVETTGQIAMTGQTMIFRGGGVGAIFKADGNYKINLNTKQVLKNWYINKIKRLELDLAYKILKSTINAYEGDERFTELENWYKNQIKELEKEQSNE